LSRELFENLLGDLANTLGMESLAPDADGYLALTIDGQDVNIQHDEKADEILIFGRLARIADENPFPFYQRLLAGNLFWQGTAGGTLSVEPRSQTVYLARSLAMSPLDLRGLEAMIQGFLDTAAYWRAETEAFDSGSGDDRRSGQPSAVEIPSKFTHRPDVMMIKA
jgi:hypothetical protein